VNSLLNKVNADDKLCAAPITAAEWTAEAITAPVLATPAIATGVISATVATRGIWGGVAPAPRIKG
jgi:hypothetical protein